MARLLLIGGDTDHNLGDRAILSALASELAKAAPGLEVTAVGRTSVRATLPPAIRDLIPPGPAGWSRLWATAGASQAVAIHGGGLFQDDDSRVKMPYWGARLGVLKRANPRLLGHSIGAGPLDRAASRSAARFACAQLESISVRDAFAHSALASCTDKPMPIVPDPAFMLVPAPAAQARALLRRLGLGNGKPLVGVAVRRWFHARGGFVPHRIRSTFELGRGTGAAELDSMLRRLADALAPLLRQLGAGLLLLPTYNVRHEADDRVCQRLAALLPGVPTALARIDDPALYKAVAGQLRLLVSARMHPLILAVGMGVPVVGLAYNGKFGGFFELLGLPPRFAWLDEIGPRGPSADLESLFSDALADAGDIGERAHVLAARSAEGAVALLQRAGLA